MFRRLSAIECSPACCPPTPFLEGESKAVDIEVCSLSHTRSLFNWFALCCLRAWENSTRFLVLQEREGIAETYILLEGENNKALRLHSLKEPVATTSQNLTENLFREREDNFKGEIATTRSHSWPHDFEFWRTKEVE